MIEVEAKVKISNPDKARLQAKKLGKYIGKQTKADDYYSLETRGYPKKSLRTRKLNGFYQVNFKHWLKNKSKIDTKKEVEFKVSNIEEFLELIHEFGFRKWISKHKTSEVYEIKKNFHIEINNVHKLGWFLEVEYLATKKEIEKARHEVMKVIREFGFDEKDIVKSGYTKLLWDKK
jgi:adenylate cyclase class 2